MLTYIKCTKKLRLLIVNVDQILFLFKYKNFNKFTFKNYKIKILVKSLIKYRNELY